MDLFPVLSFSCICSSGKVVRDWGSCKVSTVSGLIEFVGKRNLSIVSLETSDKIGSIQRRLAWPLCKDDSTNREMVKKRKKRKKKPKYCAPFASVTDLLLAQGHMPFRNFFLQTNFHL